MKKIAALLLLAGLVCLPLFRSTAQTGSVSTNISVGIQPFGKVDRRLLIDVLQGVIGEYKSVNITVLQPRKLPAFTFYPERKRYRAEKLVKFMEEAIDTTRVRRIIGITDEEISTSVGEYYDQAVMGLSDCPGHACVVSTARLGKNKVPDKKFKQRLVKAVNHELGRSLGLIPCDSPSCLMHVYGSNVKKLDANSGHLCKECADLVRVTLRKMAPPPVE